MSPDGKLKVPWDDARFLVVSGSVTSQLQNLGSQILHDCCHVHRCTSSNSLGIVALPDGRDNAIRDHPIETYLSSLWILPTGN